MSRTAINIDHIKNFRSGGIDIPKEDIEAAIKAHEEEERPRSSTAITTVLNGNLILTKNEQKILIAIKSEMINQKVEKPVISRSLFKKSYGLNSKYLDESIRSLEKKKMISREKASYTKKIKTFKWSIL